MSAPIVSAQDCCAPCESPVVENIPGPAGADGAPGADGSDGVDAFTLTTAGFTMPAVSGNVTVAVANSTWMAVGQKIFVENAGYFTVNSVPNAISVSLTNTGYTGNAAPTTIIGSGQKVSPGGIKGTDGAAGSSTLNQLSPTTTRGDLIVDNGTNNPLASDVRFPAGTDGQQLTALAAQPTGLIYRTITPNAATDNIIPRFDASGATTPTPLQSSGIQITDTTAIQTIAGNARGTSAVDLQPVRGAVTQVASGNNSAIGGGQANTASGSASVVGGGSTNEASGIDSTVAGGFTNVASGLNSTVGGGQGATAAAISSTVAGGNTNQISAAATGGTIGGGENNLVQSPFGTIPGGSAGTISTLLADYSVIPGGLYGRSELYGQVAHGSGRFSDAGDAQTSELIWRRETANATLTELFLDGASRRAIMFGFSSWAFHIFTVARNTGTDLSAVWETKGGVKRSGGVISLIGVVTHALLCNDGEAWMVAGGVAVDVDVPNVGLRIRVTGAAATTIRWVATARLIQCNYVT